ncbi:uncharacterized protein LOC127788356 [Diospyros lotus]|uniref:uncharacterized protein LOC127788356 n=1 Tax=Diospyros lotus TaxID=55363 RepID=UPI00224F2D41|nr:uncharacterized protein LOC127788356 [Diospyros lotus]
MAKREISSTLRNLKFMQRAAQREEKSKKVEEVIPDGNFPATAIKKKCIVIVEGDPHPGATKGRMSFLSFNPSIDKLNGEAANPGQPETSTSNQNGRTSDREIGSTQDGMEIDSFSKEADGELKRKQPEVLSETKHPNKSQKNGQSGQESSQNNSKSSHKQPKHGKLDWNVLRPPKGQKQQDIQLPSSLTEKSLW